VPVILNVPPHQQGIFGQADVGDEQVGPAHLLEILLLDELGEVLESRVLLGNDTSRIATINLSI
jgi:hypothetical protein